MGSHGADAEVITIDSDDDDLGVASYLNSAINSSMNQSPTALGMQLTFDQT